MSSPLGIAPSRPEKHNLCGECAATVHIHNNGCLIKHCPSCDGILRFATKMCLKCSTSKGLCQVCEKPLAATPAANAPATDAGNDKAPQTPPQS